MTLSLVNSVENPSAKGHHAFLAAQERIAQVITDASSLNAQYTNRALDYAWYCWLNAPLYGLNWDAVLSQGFHESQWMQSPVSLALYNTAGIKYGPHPPHGHSPSEYRIYPHLEAGTQDQCALLAVYTGLYVHRMFDPTRNERIRPIVHRALGGRYATEMTDLNRIWAWPGREYGQNIERVWNRIFA